MVVVVVAVFVVRLVDVQLVSAATINAEAEGRRGVTATVWGDRGEILDARGTVFAGSVDRFDITVAPVNAGDFTRSDANGVTHKVTRDQALGEIAAVTGQAPQQLITVVDAALAADPHSQFAYLARLVSLQQYEAIRALKVPWLYYERHSARVYPNGAVAGNLTGFLGGDGDPLAGLELSHNSCLDGTDGKVVYESGRDGIPIPGSEVTVEQMHPGGDLMLTIDGDLQWYAQQVIAQEVLRMGGQYGHVIVQEVKTGRLVAVAEYPTVDPNNPGLSDPDDRGSRAFTSPYEPGSTIKAITAASVFDRGLSTPAEQLTVPGVFNRNGASFADDWAHGDERLTVAGVMANSSNIGIAMLGERLQAADRYDYFTKFGLGSTTATGFLGEESGTVHEVGDWDPQTNYATMFGQGLQATAPQIASVFQTIANGGTRLPVELVSGCRAADGTVTPTESPGPVQVVSPQAAADTLTTLEATAQAGHYAATTSIPGYRVGLKTGTAQMSDGSGAYLAGSYFTSMAGVAPIDDPAYVVVASIANPTTMRSSGATAQAWHDVMAYALQQNRVAPSPQPWPTIPTTF